MPSTRNSSRLSEQSTGRFTTNDFVKKCAPPRIKKCKPKSKKPAHSKRLVEQFDEQDEGMFWTCICHRNTFSFCLALINFNKRGIKVISLHWGQTRDFFTNYFYFHYYHETDNFLAAWARKNQFRKEVFHLTPKYSQNTKSFFSILRAK